MEKISEKTIESLKTALTEIEPYIPTMYVDYSEPDIDAEHLNHAEQAIKRATDAINQSVKVINTLNNTVDQLNRDIISGYLSLTVKNTHLTLFVQELDFVNGVAKIEASKYLGYTPKWLGAVCQPNVWGDGTIASLSIAYSDNIISVYMTNKPDFNGKSWLTAMIISTK